MAMRTAALYTPKKQRISLTALIDVVFILLLFFMLTTNFNHWYAVDVSTASSSEKLAKVKVVTLLIHKDKQVALYEQQKTVSHFSQLKLSDVIANKGQLTVETKTVVIVLPHAAVHLQTLLNVMAHLNTIGVENASIGHSFTDATIGRDAS